ncbi:MBL fold metallo-hydrolase [Arvimicrobium flavum]|uniref:MBL fold metallo-hydrolase n=1 Tax=Arvimicrobium flavum TaxID=3393320 RepID=UPI00237B351D|nr:MBL fold metallo-hydrolase [Mesorhizobium shangrilense]
MAEPAFQVHFWGVRGSIPVSGAQYARYGGNTACIEIRSGNRRLILDGGSGLRPAGDALRASGIEEIDVFLTHTHYDHVIGLPFFHPLYMPSIKLVLWSGHMWGRTSTLQLFEDFMRPPWFPVNVDSCRCHLDCRDFAPGDTLSPREGVVIRTGSLNHPGGCVGYRVEWEGRSIALISDTEHIPGKLDATVLELIRDADLVIYDATYTEAEMKRYRGFGHSTWQQGIKLCEAAGARRLALFHHDPSRTDAELDEIEAQARARFAGAFAARDGMTVDL